MYKIEKKNYGYKLIFDANINLPEMSDWVEDARKNLVDAKNEFGVFVDMRGLRPLSIDSQSKMQEGQILFKEKGMIRSVVIVASATIKMQFQRIAKETGIYEWERYIDSSSSKDWEEIGINWISKGIDPDK